jgi:hypothetical protein
MRPGTDPTRAAARFALGLVRWLGRLAALPLRFYRRFLSPFKPPLCRFSPSCSSYAIEALEKRGLIVGLVLAAWRLLRCQPLCRGGFDPVPKPPPGRRA